jgi:glycolate oxidase iron-sulfur subunit
MAWVTKDPPSRLALDSCVTCGLCLPACPTFRLTGDETASPRGRLTAMTAAANGDAVVGERFAEIMSFCLQCRACESACPSLVPFGEAMEATRSEVDAQVRSSRSWLRHFTVTAALRSRPFMQLVTIVSIALAKLGLLKRMPVIGSLTGGMRPMSLPVKTVSGTAVGDADAPVAMLLSGCVADVWFSNVHRSAIDVLVAAGYRIEVPKQQTCCGALAAHSGYAAETASMARVNIAAFKDADVIVTDVAGCGAHMQTYSKYGADGSDLGARVRDISDLVSELISKGALPVVEQSGVTVGIQDPCHLEHGQKVHTSVDVVVEAAGYQSAPIDRGGLCCGAAGLYQIAHPEVSEELGRAKASTVERTGASIVVSANAGCEMQLRRYLESDVRVMHPIELYAEALLRAP